MYRARRRKAEPDRADYQRCRREAARGGADVCDWLITKGRGPKHVVKTGVTPALYGKEWRLLIDALRDRALIATLTYGFAALAPRSRCVSRTCNRRGRAG
jgi:hypothetical protein